MKSCCWAASCLASTLGSTGCGCGGTTMAGGVAGGQAGRVSAMAELPAPCPLCPPGGTFPPPAPACRPPSPPEGTWRLQSNLTWDRPHGWHHGHGCRHHGWLVAGHLHHPWVHCGDRVLPRQCPPGPPDSLPPAPGKEMSTGQRGADGSYMGSPGRASPRHGQGDPGWGSAPHSPMG